MITATAKRVRRGIKTLMDAIDADAHVRITRRGKDHVNGVLTPEAWYEEAKHALAIVNGLTQLGTQGLTASKRSEVVGARQLADLFDDGRDEVMAAAS